MAKYGCIRNFVLDESTQKKLWSDEKETNSNFHLQMVQQNCQEETTNSRNTILSRENHRKEWTSQRRVSRRTWRVSTDRTQRWRGSPHRLRVDSRWLHLSPSQRTPNSTLCAERRNISYSTEIHWCDQNYASWFCERVVYHHGAILLIVRRRSGYFPRRCWHWRWSTGQSTGRVRKRRGKRRRETREGHTRRRNQQTIKHTSWMTWRWNEARTQTRWMARLEPCSVICMKLNVQTAWEKWRVKCICLHTPSVTVDRHRL